MHVLNCKDGPIAGRPSTAVPSCCQATGLFQWRGKTCRFALLSVCLSDCPVCSSSSSYLHAPVHWLRLPLAQLHILCYSVCRAVYVGPNNTCFDLLCSICCRIVHKKRNSGIWVFTWFSVATKFSLSAVIYVYICYICYIYTLYMLYMLYMCLYVSRYTYSLSVSFSNAVWYY